MLLWLVAILLILLTSAEATGSLLSVALPGCKESCQNSTVKIPYPFGIGVNCYYDKWYEIVCNSSSSATKRPVLKKFGVEVLSFNSCFSNNCDISDLRLEVATQWQNICTISTTQQKVILGDLDKSPFRMSSAGNNVVVKGCPAVATLMNRKGEKLAGCSSSVCKGSNKTVVGVRQRSNKVSGSICDQVGCCSISLLDQNYLGVDYYQMGLRSRNGDTNETCVEIALVERFLEPKEKIAAFKKIERDDLVPTVWHWMPPAYPDYRPFVYGSHSSQKSIDFSCDPACGIYDEVQCINFCRCNVGFEGNPYVPNGCLDPCKTGTNHSSLKCKKRSLATLTTILGLSIGLGSLTLLVCCYGLYRFLRRWIQIKKRDKFFEKNGGLLLQQQMSSNGGVIDSTRVFTARELEKATDNFDKNRVLGHGGQGTVYKGMLLDGRVVAIKKPKNVGKIQSDHFINEVVILSQINHRNVVKLLGCCLETEVPLLVYEFVPNGTLAKSIHDPSEDFQITWKMRLQIAAETAGALAYLHSSSATPIYHRDIKSSNILLDSKYRAKLSDFGTSRTMMIDQTHLTTRVQGTFGYLDPEYFQSNQFTEKSDVYSFGVVLVELLTGKTSVSKSESGEWKGLATEFLLHYETSSLHKILDAQVLNEAKEEELAIVVNLARRCLYLSGKKRPTMKEVASVLEGIGTSNMASVIDQNIIEGDDMIVEMSEMNDGYLGSTTSYSTKNDLTSSSFEIQPFVHNSV